MLGRDRNCSVTFPNGTGPSYGGHLKDGIFLSQTVGHWIYGECSALPYLRSRQAYLTEVGPKREALLRAAIDLYAPRAVVFLGWSYMADWRRLIETPLELREQPRRDRAPGDDRLHREPPPDELWRYK